MSRWYQQLRTERKRKNRVATRKTVLKSSGISLKFVENVCLKYSTVQFAFNILANEGKNTRGESRNEMRREAVDRRKFTSGNNVLERITRHPKTFSGKTWRSLKLHGVKQERRREKKKKDTYILEERGNVAAFDGNALYSGYVVSSFNRLPSSSGTVFLLLSERDPGRMVD